MPGGVVQSGEVGRSLPEFGWWPSAAKALRKHGECAHAGFLFTPQPFCLFTPASYCPCLLIPIVLFYSALLSGPIGKEVERFKQELRERIALRATQANAAAELRVRSGAATGRALRKRCDCAVPGDRNLGEGALCHGLRRQSLSCTLTPVLGLHTLRRRSALAPKDSTLAVIAHWLRSDRG